MANLHVISSGSKGNSYILSSGGQHLILEIGVNPDKLLRALKMPLESISGCLVTHVHGDHFNVGTAKKLRMFSIPIYSSRSVSDKSTEARINVVCHKQKFSVGGFKIIALSVPHGEAENMAYVINLPQGEGTLLFATDLSDFPYTLSGLNYMLIEANYDNNIIFSKLIEDEDIRSNSKTHLEITQCYNVVKRHYSDNLCNVVLLHLSDSLSDEAAFVSRFEDMCFKCCAASDDKDIELSLTPF